MRVSILLSTVFAGSLLVGSAMADRPGHYHPKYERPEPQRALQMRGEIFDGGDYVVQTKEHFKPAARSTTVTTQKTQKSAAKGQKVARERSDMADENMSAPSARIFVTAQRNTGAGARGEVHPRIANMVQKSRSTAGAYGDEGFVVTHTDLSTGKAPAPYVAKVDSTTYSRSTAQSKSRGQVDRRDETPAQRNARIRDAVRTNPVLGRLLAMMKRSACGKIGSECGTDVEASY